MSTVADDDDEPQQKAYLIIHLRRKRANPCRRHMPVLVGGNGVDELETFNHERNNASLCRSFMPARCDMENVTAAMIFVALAGKDNTDCTTMSCLHRTPTTMNDNIFSMAKRMLCRVSFVSEKAFL